MKKQRIQDIIASKPMVRATGPRPRVASTIMSVDTWGKGYTANIKINSLVMQAKLDHERADELDRVDLLDTHYLNMCLLEMANKEFVDKVRGFNNVQLISFVQNELPKLQRKWFREAERWMPIGVAQGNAHKESVKGYDEVITVNVKSSVDADIENTWNDRQLTSGSILYLVLYMKKASSISHTNDIGSVNTVNVNPIHDFKHPYFKFVFDYFKSPENKRLFNSGFCSDDMVVVHEIGFVMSGPSFSDRETDLGVVDLRMRVDDKVNFKVFRDRKTIPIYLSI